MRIAVLVLGAHLGLCVVLVAAPAEADPGADRSQVVVAVDCPSLGAEQRAALESRANAELLVREVSGTLVVVCSVGHARLAWHSLAGPSAESTVPLDADAQVSVERVLDAFDQLLDSVADLPRSTSAATVEPSPDSAAPPATSPKPPPPSASAPSGNVAGGSADTRDPARTEPTPIEPRRGIAGAVGVSSELWSASVVGALGPRARLEVTFRGRIALDAGGSLWWTLRSPEGVNGTLGRVHAGAYYFLDEARRFRIGAAGFVDLFHASPDASLHTTAVNRTTPGAGLRADYALLNAPFRVVTGPTLNFHLGSVRVEFGDRKVFDIPAVAFGWTVEALLGPF